jgi:hypothetical protein
MSAETTHAIPAWRKGTQGFFAFSFTSVSEVVGAFPHEFRSPLSAFRSRFFSQFGGIARLLFVTNQRS